VTTIGLVGVAVTGVPTLPKPTPKASNNDAANTAEAMDSLTDARERL
jgi:hypothetical protein